MKLLKTLFTKPPSLSKDNGYTLSELMIAASLTLLVTGVAGFGFQAVLQSYQKDQASNVTFSRINNTLKLVSDEIYSAIRVEVDVAEAVTEKAPSLSLPTGAIPVLALQMPDVFERVVYYIDEPDSDSKLAPKVLFRWGPAYDENGQYESDEIEKPELWVSSAVSDLVTSDPIEEPDCPPGDWQANPPSNAEGFYSCINTKTPGLVQLYMTSTIERTIGDPVSKSMSTSAFARAKQKQGIGENIPKFQIVDNTLTLKDPAKVTFEVLGGEITCGPGGPKVPVTTSLYLNDKTESEPWDITQPLTLPNLDSETTINIESIADAPFCGNYYFEVSSKDSTSKQLTVLMNGDFVPDITPFDNQNTIDDFLEDYIEDGKIKLADNQAIYLFELGTTNKNSSAFDLQDNVVLGTIEPQ